MNKDDNGIVAAICFALLFVILLGGLFYSAGKISGMESVVSGYHEGELPVGIPVMLYWYEADGTISGASAVRTDFGGVLPHSTTMSAVPYIKYTKWDFWYPLENVEVAP
jgi:hypothetical protein